MLSQFKAFPELKRLNLRFSFLDNNNNNYVIDVNQLFSFELFKVLSNITHLTLCFEGKEISNESIFREIFIYLPKLQYLEILDPLNFTSKGDKELADILSLLECLETLKLNFISGVDFSSFKKN